MKITEQELKRIIREEVQRTLLEVNPVPTPADVWRPSVSSLAMEKEVGSSEEEVKTPLKNRNITMKITRRKLNQIITEEVKKALNEQNRYDVEGDDVAGSASSAISGVWMALSSLGGNPQEHTFKGRRQMLEITCAYLEGAWHHIAKNMYPVKKQRDLAIAAIAAAEAKFKDGVSYDKQQGDKSICAPNKKWPKKGKCPAAKYGAAFPATVYNYLDMYPGLGLGGVKKQQIKYVLTVIYHFAINPEEAMKKYGDPREEISYGANYKPRRWSCK